MVKGETPGIAAVSPCLKADFDMQELMLPMSITPKSTQWRAIMDVLQLLQDGLVEFSTTRPGTKPTAP